MTDRPQPAAAEAAPCVLSVDAMGGDRGASAVVAGMAEAAGRDASVNFVLHGPEAVLEPLVRRRGRELEGRVTLRDAPDVLPMDAAPGRAVRSARGTSMLSAVRSVADGETAVAVSCGNTGALMALGALHLRRAPGVDRPAIAVLWPARTPAGANVLLDAGADVRAEPATLLQYGVMGAEYARLALGLDRPRVGVLNVGAELHKGGPALREAAARLAEAAEAPGARFSAVGFVEGDDIPRDRADVVVTDGFTGNVALKTAEGTASFIGDALREAFRTGPMTRLSAVLAGPALRGFRRRIDPRRMNGGVFLGLEGGVVKSHGDADATAIAAALDLAARMARTGFAGRVAQEVAKTAPAADGARAASAPSERPAE